MLKGDIIVLSCLTVLQYRLLRHNIFSLVLKGTQHVRNEASEIVIMDVDVADLTVSTHLEVLVGLRK